MKCYCCQEDTLVWQCDFTYEDYGIGEAEGIVTELLCGNEECNASIRVYKEV